MKYVFYLIGSPLIVFTLYKLAAPQPQVKGAITAAPTVFIVNPPTSYPLKPNDTPLLATIDASGIQVLKATYSKAFGLQPKSFTVKAAIPVRFEIAAVDDGTGCMGSIMLPKLLPDNIQFFHRGQTNIFNFTVSTPGDYQITCAMGVPHGTVIVQ